jgi:Fur family peroxide stress response transcriptional regulator
MLRDLRRSGLKLTPQRIAIVRLFAEDLSHPTAQDLFERLRPTFPSMSVATVYNTLDTLARVGLAGIVRLPGKRGDAARFDPNGAPHHHAVCDRCGAVIDIAAGTLAPSARAEGRLRRSAPGFSVRVIERIYRGLCATCVRPMSS